MRGRAKYGTVSRLSQMQYLRAKGEATATSEQTAYYVPEGPGDSGVPQMVLPNPSMIERLKRIPVAVSSKLGMQDSPTPDQGQMNELNESELWRKLAPPSDRAVAIEEPRMSGSDSVSGVYDTPLRSAVKAMGWRITAGFVTALTSLFFTGGSWQVAASMVGSDFATKSVTMFVGERLWNKSQAGRSATDGESPWRSIAKAVAWRLFAVCNTLVMGLLFAKSLSVASKIASTDAVIKTTLMVAYERLWNRINWGRNENTAGVGI